MIGITALQIKNLLAAKHSKDLFFDEVKTGSSYLPGLRIIDGLAIKKSWSPVGIYGYEIKVSRSDFLKDSKWENYLDYCTNFSFVCPRELIQPEELPDGVGLLWVTKNGKRIYTKRKSVRRDPSWRKAGHLLLYLLMWRMKVGQPESVDKAQYWRDWLEYRAGKQYLGHIVSKRIKKIASDAQRRMLQAEDRAALAERKVKSYEHVRTELSRHGVDPDSVWDLEHNTNTLWDGGATDLIQQAKNAIDELAETIDLLKH